MSEACARREEVYLSFKRLDDGVGVFCKGRKVRFPAVSAMSLCASLV